MTPIEMMDYARNHILIVAGVVIVGAVTEYTIRYIMYNGFPFFSAE